jgi:hypothetical protein
MPKPRSSHSFYIDTHDNFYQFKNRRKALIYIDLFNIKQASGTDPYGRY